MFIMSVHNFGLCKGKGKIYKKTWTRISENYWILKNYPNLLLNRQLLLVSSLSFANWSPARVNVRSSYKKLSSLYVKEEGLLSTFLAYFMIITTITGKKKKRVKLQISKCTSCSKVEIAVMIVRTEMGTNTHQVQKKENTQMSHFVLDLRQATQEVLNLSLSFPLFFKIFP